MITVLAPDPATTVVWRMTPAGESDVLVAGPRTKAAYHLAKELPVCVRVQVRPGLVLPILGTAADDLVDRVVPLPDLCGPSAEALAQDLIAYRDRPEQAVEAIGNYLDDRMPRRLPTTFELIGSAAAELSRPRTVGETAVRLGVSERYLRRVFHQSVGLSPKHFARINRVRTVIANTQRSEARHAKVRHGWAQLAAAAGYTDQSHLIADFRALMRVTPTAFADGRVPLSTC